ncbi:hypothetical protein E1200_21770 [Actinomadura sp. GC306]|uniref:hypothetical protein n=1 Tax=Actinomadura sp. GC306 TaxID=2530367 RepID=UPI00104AA83C|nr:hypothetical protein [Actinomadura sp. GC306]TDC63651.1 hypothetical protein E1200_21770 [Actinomadura sp. GC306]
MADPWNMSIAEQMSANQARLNAEWDAQQKRYGHQLAETAAGRGPRPAGDGWFWGAVLTCIPVVVVYFVVSGMVAGAQWLAHESLLAPLFPAPGDSVARYALSCATLILLVPGGLTLIAMRMRGTRLRWLRFVLIPLAVLMVFVILQLTQSTATAELVRLPT